MHSCSRARWFGRLSYFLNNGINWSVHSECTFGCLSLRVMANLVWLMAYFEEIVRPSMRWDFVHEDLVHRYYPGITNFARDGKSQTRRPYSTPFRLTATASVHQAPGESFCFDTRRTGRHGLHSIDFKVFFTHCPLKNINTEYHHQKSLDTITRTSTNFTQSDCLVLNAPCITDGTS